VLFAAKAAAVVIAASAAGVAGHAELGGHAQAVQAASAGKVYYTVQPGDTLSRIARYFCHSASRYHELAAANGISNPNVINVGQRLWLACGGTGVSSSNGGGSNGSSGSSGSSTSQPISGSDYAAGSAVIPAASVQLSFAGLERLWINAGGSSGTAYHAACIAEHESSGRSWAISPTNDWGLWQIHNGGPEMLNTFTNARKAIAMSGNGTNWSQWTTRNLC
jgi:LysM repeat protein